MNNDRDLLQAYVRDHSDAAFRELVRRHTALVFSCARQQLGDQQAAEDVTQSVFIALAIKAPQLPAATILAGWLYRATRFAAADYRRREQHRREREMKAHEQHQIHQSATDSAAVWQEIQPHLHAALDNLSAADRAAVLLRFYQQSSYRDMAQTLAITEEAAKKRVGRAVERLRRFFGRRGIGLTAGVLVTALGTRAVEATPATLAAQAAQTALGTLAGTMASTTESLMIAKGAIHAMFIAKVKAVSLAAAACLVVAGTGVVAAKQLAGSSTPAPSETTIMEPATTPVLVAAAPVPVTPVQPPTGTPVPVAPTAAEAPLRFTEADNGKTVTVKVGQEFEVVLRSNRKLTGWEGGGPSAPCVVRLINENGFRYRAVEPGSCAIGFHLVYPSGPGVETRRRTQLLGEFKLTVEVIADGAAATPRAASLATTQPIRLANGLELVAFGPSQAEAPTRTRPTPLTLGVRVTNPTAQPQEFWPHKVQLLLRWGHGELRTVGVNQNGTPRVRAVAIPAGGTQSFPLAGAHIGYIGKPQYLAFYSETLLGNQYYEQINGEADQIGLAFEYEQDQPSPRTGEIVCRLVAGAAEAASVVNEYVAQQTAQLWVTAFLQGRNDQLAALAETPFCLFNEQVGTAEELATRLAKAQQDAKRWSEWFTAGKLRLEKVELLKGEAAAFTAGRSFKELANPGNVAFLRVRLLIELENERGGVDFGVAIQPANHRVVGFGND